MSEPLQNKHGPEALSHREREVCEWMAAGKTNWEIGCILGCSKETVKKHVQNICRILDVPNRTAAAAMYGRHCGLVSRDAANSVRVADATASPPPAADIRPVADSWP